MADDTEEIYSRDELKVLYKEAHTNGNEELLEKLNHHGKKYLNSVGFSEKFEIFHFIPFLKEILKTSSDKTAIAFMQIRKGFVNLEKYGIKLLQCPWRKEFYSIKLYTPFFKHKIEPKIASSLAAKILNLYGYKEKSKDVLQLEEPEKSFDIIHATAFELFLAAIELEIMSDVAKEVELYTDEFKLRDIIKARKVNIGDAKYVSNSLLKTKGLSSASKKRKLYHKNDDKIHEDASDTQDNALIKGIKSRSFSQERPTTTNSRGLTDHSSKTTKSDSLGRSIATYIGSSNTVGLLSDEELYGVDHGYEVQIQDEDLHNGLANQTMQVEPEPPKRKNYSVNQSDYEDMTENNCEDDYEPMTRSRNGLTQPHRHIKDLPPPPPYSEAVHANFPDNEWHVIENPANQRDQDVSKAIPGLSGLNIHENETRFENGDVEEQKFKKSRGRERCFIVTSAAEEENIEKNISSSTRSTTIESYASSGLNNTPKTTYSKISDSSNDYVNIQHENPKASTGDSQFHPRSTSEYQLSQGYRNKTELDHRGNSQKYESPRVTTAERQLRSKSVPEYQMSREHKEKIDLDYSVKRRTSSKNDEFHAYNPATKSTASEVKFPPSSYSQSSVTETFSKDIQHSKSNSSEMLLTLSTSRDRIQPGHGSRDIEYNHTSSRSVTQKHVPSNEPRQDVCMVCDATATHCCATCSKLCCLNCIPYLSRILCEGAQVHRIVERTSSQEKDFMDKDKCVNCKKPSTHKCSICKIKSCAVCQHVGPFKDQCQSSIGHIFVLIKSDVTSYNRPQSLDAEIQRDLNQQNICDQCSMTAKFICADCHNRVCKECLDIFKRDLCAATKKEHFFHTITAQIQRTDTKKAKSWSCERCTYLNPPENTICSMCATTQGISGIEYPESGSRRCGVCTYGNKEGARICAMCHQTLGLDKAESYL